MNQNDLLTFTLSLNWCIFFFILLPGKSFSADSRYEACLRQQQHCANGPNISFPFYIQGLQQSYCGYPGFNLSCDIDGFPTLRIPDNYYIIEEIFYHNRSLVIRNSAFQGPEESCLPEIRNTSLDSSKFSYVNTSNLYLLSNCSKEAIDRLGRFRVGCDDQNREIWDLAMFREDENFSYALQECNTSVDAPVELHENEERNGIDYYKGLLTRGFLVNWTASDCSECEESGGFCGFETDIFHFRCFCPDRPRARSCKPSRKRLLRLRLIAVTAFSAGGIAILSISILCFRKRHKIGKFVYFWKAQAEKNKDIETFLKNYGSLAPKRYSYSDIKKMTNRFKLKLGKGGHGCVFKGELGDGNSVAVKMLNESKGSGDEFINEVAAISRTAHVNIVTLLGFCFEGRQRALVYEFMPNGSLEKYIYDEKSLAVRQLEWQTLYKIAVGIARGLEYLHLGCTTRIVHFDIKPNNILLDEDFCPKISDFGLAKLCRKKESIVSLLGIRGTIGFIAPEVVCKNSRGVSHKSDVYSYGMMVLEMVGGRRNVDIGVDVTSEIYFPHWIYSRLELEQELGLSGISNEAENECARKMVTVGIWCIQMDPANRPSMNKVVEMLEGNLDSLEKPPKPFLYSPSRSESESSRINIQ